MRLVIALVLSAVLASPALAQSAPASPGRSYEHTVGAPQKPTTWTPPAVPAEQPAQQPPASKHIRCGAPRGATPKGGGTVNMPICR